MRNLSRRALLLAPLAPDEPPRWSVETIFREILDGYLRNSRRTSNSWAVCDFEGGTILPASVTPKGKTYDSVSRMLPALAAWAVRTGEHVDVLTAIFQNAFDPQHPDYWGVVTNKQNQRQVESSVVAWSLWLARDLVLPKLSSQSRSNINAWLAANTVYPVRTNNWAWFTAVNHAARIALSRQWKEFSGDEKSMLADIQFLDSLAGPGSDGWYSDSPKEPAYDYYNFWVFASHFLYWNKILGAKYPALSAKFTLRLKQFLESTPYCFGANGSHVLYGRSLIYRWAALTPLVLAYDQGLWPYSPGLLRRIIRGNIEFFWKADAFDTGRGKLLETLTPDGSTSIRESYIDNGHPYWGMQAFVLWAIPNTRPLWTAKEEPLPVEQRSFVEPLRGPRLLLSGNKATGEVRWMLAVNGHNEPSYAPKYSKFTYSTNHPWGTTFDSSLQFLGPDGKLIPQSGVEGGRLEANGYERRWWTRVGDDRVNVISTITWDRGIEIRRHRITGPAGIHFIEGSPAYAEQPERSRLKSSHGYDNTTIVEQLGANIIHGRTWIISLEGVTKEGVTELGLELR